MDLFEAIEKRASVRQFAPSSISKSELKQIIDAGRRAPSGNNRQPWEFIGITDEDILAKLGKIQDCIGQAAGAIAIVVDEDATAYWKEDAAAAIENMLLAATALGYGSLWVEGYVLKNEDYGKQVLNIPDDKRLIAIIPIGKPAGTAQQAPKKGMNEIVYLNRYGKSWGA
jgi:nitroreductase